MFAPSFKSSMSFHSPNFRWAFVGKGVGKAADALMDEAPPDTSGVNIRYRDPSATAPAAAEVPATTASPTPAAPSDGLPPQY